MKYATRNGRVVQTSPGDRLGRGGEGEVVPVVGAPGLVAKLFKNPTPELCSKLELMIARPLPQPEHRPMAAWPVDLLFSRGSKRRFVGYLMAKADGKPLFICYNPAARQQHFPDFDYQHLVRVARNLALAMAFAHGLGYVIGDENESNCLVSPDACTTHIDVDSWQVPDPALRTIYLCRVAKPEFLPPELQRTGFSRIKRLPEHDAFSLAVLLFKLMMAGLHPCDGVYHSADDAPDLPSRIHSAVFPWRDRSGLWSPRAVAPPFSSLDPAVQRLFIRCFEAGHHDPKRRPLPSDWAESLGRAENRLQRCRAVPSHFYWGNSCCWCALRVRSSSAPKLVPARPGSPRSCRLVPSSYVQPTPATRGLACPAHSPPSAPQPNVRSDSPIRSLLDLIGGLLCIAIGLVWALIALPILAVFLVHALPLNIVLKVLIWLVLVFVDLTVCTIAFLIAVAKVERTQGVDVLGFLS